MKALPPGATVVELGPGAAHVARLSGRSDLRWLGIESSLDCLPALSGILSGGVLADLEAQPRLPRCDAVLSGDTLEHMNDPEGMLRRIQEALPSGGLLLISVPNVANAYVRLNLLFGRFPYADRGILDRTHRYFFTRASLRRMLEAHGFEVQRGAVSTIPLPLALPGLPGPLLALLTGALSVATRLLPKLLGFQLLFVARKK
ncbi:MAG TPA: class I SAM-dependent methyltransferase [Thermoanaerobaculia bacterium]|nr:class I SAM-dependent methyltransferase [Thermoanaerobaculia bacterium]